MTEASASIRSATHISTTVNPVHTTGAQRLVWMEGFEPPAPCSQGRRSAQAELHPDNLVASADFETATLTLST